MSKLRDRKLAPAGERKLQWVERHMPVLELLGERLRQEQVFAGHRVAICLHLEAKTAYLADTLRRAGAEVSICGSNPLSTQDDVAAALAERGVNVFAWYGASNEEYDEFLDEVIASQPDLLIDDGGDLVSKLHQEHAGQLAGIIGGAEETTTGVIRLKSMAREGVLSFPMMAVNDAYCKYLFDNRYGTGQSVWDGIMRTTNLTVAGKHVVVAGYGWCGKGVAMRAKGLGADVTVCEVDPIKANEALMDGYAVTTMAQAAPTADFIVTVTGCAKVVRGPHYEQMKDGVILANAGHFDIEVYKPDLDALAVDSFEARDNVRSYVMADGRHLNLLAEGRLVNLAAADGHPAEIMDMTFSLQALALRYLVQDQDELADEVLAVPEEMDREVAQLRLDALGVEIDSLTPEQEEYLNSWQAGTHS